jgi:hypothetical protein
MDAITGLVRTPWREIISPACYSSFGARRIRQEQLQAAVRERIAGFRIAAF